MELAVVDGAAAEGVGDGRVVFARKTTTKAVGVGIGDDDGTNGEIEDF